MRMLWFIRSNALLKSIKHTLRYCERASRVRSQLFTISIRQKRADEPFRLPNCLEVYFASDIIIHPSYDEVFKDLG
jgi:hypothetical protein